MIEAGKPRFPLLLKSGLDFLLEVAKTVVISVTIIVLVRHFLFKPFYVKGASMEPTFLDHQYLIINEIDYRFRQPERGDIIVLRYPKDPSQFFIKRIIGLPNETVEIRDNHVSITNQDHPEGFVLDEGMYLDAEVKTVGGQSTVLGSDQYFVLGDNRSASLDSRSVALGPIHRSAIIGRAWFRVWPFQKFTVFRSPDYPPTTP